MPAESSRGISRRRLLAGAAGLSGVALAGAFASCGDDDAPEPSPISTTDDSSPAGGDWFEPAVIASTNGRLDLTLVLEEGVIASAAGRRWAITVNGSTPGPTLRIRPGDHLRITLENRLGTPTNLHTHGLHVSPTGSADNPFVEIAPGARHTYEIDVPRGHRSTLAWYHPHLHHHVAAQLFAGFFGAILVEGEDDQLAANGAIRQRLLLLQDTRPGTSAAAVTGTAMDEQMRGREGPLQLVNGLVLPELKVEAGTLERWRILNASPSRFYRLALEGHQLALVGTDGGAILRPLEHENLVLVPGERLDVLVRPDLNGTFTLRSSGVERGQMGAGMGGGAMVVSPAVDLLRMSVGDRAAPVALPGPISSLEDVRSLEAVRSREFVFDMRMMQLPIDGKQFDPGRIDIRASLSTVEDWTLRNVSPMDHPFHIHVWPFQVLETSSTGREPPAWKDVVNIPAGGWVRIRILFRDIPGKTVFHCHILDHEDMGMMGVIAVG